MPHSSSLPLITDRSRLEEFVRTNQLPHREFRRFRGAFFQRGLSMEAFADLSPELAGILLREFSMHSLRLLDRKDSVETGATKLLFLTHDGLRIESVILRLKTGRCSVCVSSQAGCAEGCRFCGTASMGFSRNLSKGEMIDQVLHSRQILYNEGAVLRNVVFMGMGEPLRNLEEVTGTVETLLHPRYFNFSPFHLTLSTSGLPQELLLFAGRFPKVQLTLSLNSALPALRSELMPVSGRVPLSELRTVLRTLESIRSREVMVSIILFAGVNDREEDLAALIEFAGGLRVRMNLLPYNPPDVRGNLDSSPVETRQRFARSLRKAGFEVTVRQSLGGDISAACGQLADRPAGKADSPPPQASITEVP